MKDFIAEGAASNDNKKRVIIFITERELTTISFIDIINEFEFGSP